MGEGGLWREKLRQQVARSQEPVPGLPLVEITGLNRVLIENHRGICCYDREKIRIRVKFGEITVTGCGLELAHMSRERVAITGQIASVELHREVGP